MELSVTAERRGPLLGFLRQELGLSSSLVARLKAQGAFLVNGVPVFTNHPVVPGDRVLARLQERAPDFPAQEGPLSILYEDDGLIALDKPPGLLIHPTANRQTGTLANRLLGYYARTQQACGIHPVSRLDRDTFGVVLFAKHAHLHALCGAGFEKIYHATVLGSPAAAEGDISLPIARKGGGSLWREVRADGQPSLTRYRVLAQTDVLTYLELRPITGRTHQLRVHALASGFPILGDPVYTNPAEAAYAARLGLHSQQLLAHTLRFVHPLSGERVQIRTKQAVYWP